MVKFDVHTEGSTNVPEDVTLNLYSKLNLVIELGIMPVMVSEVEDVNVPMFIGLAKLPLESLSCKVNTLPAGKDGVMV